MTRKKRFVAILIKPSHYDRDGYVIQWIKSTIPSNSLASVYGLIEDCGREKILGDDVEIEIIAFDETNTILRPEKLIKAIKSADGGFVGMIGVQSNQFPRAVDIGRQFRAAGIPVLIGGFHVSGCLAMLPEIPQEIRQAQGLGMILYAGEAEGRMDELLRDIWNGTPKPLYNFMSDLPNMENATIPILPADVVKRNSGAYTSFDSGRGCPFQCSFCTIINVQGRKSRYRTPDDIEHIIRLNAEQDIKRFFITDDNFARNKNWEAILDRLIHLREVEKLRFKIILQVDTLCHKLPRFIEKASRAGCHRIFIGLENIDPDALMAAKKRQNKIWEYRKMLQAWKDHGVLTIAGYILGFPDDTPEKVHRNIEIIKKEMPLDIIEFFFLTPLPGSEDHKVMHLAGTWMDPDINFYDLHHRVSHHPKMSDAEWEKLYRDCWLQYYNLEHMETVLYRGAASGLKIKNLWLTQVAFYCSIMYEDVHPLECGVIRRKVRRQRRSGLPIEPAITFYPKRAYETARALTGWLSYYFKTKPVYEKVRKDPDAKTYADLALTPVSDEEENNMDLIKVFEDAIPDTYGAPTKSGQELTKKAKQGVRAGRASLIDAAG